MISTTFGGKSVYLIDDQPDWESKVSATFEAVSQFEESISRRETRRPYAETIRMRLQQSYTLEGTASFKFADALKDYQLQPVLVPLFQSSSVWSARASAPITGGLKVAYKFDWSQWELYTTSEPAWVLSTDYVAPVVYGRLDAPEIRWINDRVAKVDLTLLEDGPEAYAITAKEVAFTDGPSLAGWDTPNRWIGPDISTVDTKFRPEYYDPATGNYTPNTFTPLANTGTNAALRINQCLIKQGRVELGEGVYTLGTAGSVTEIYADYNMILFGNTDYGYPKDNVQIIGRGIGKTTLKLADNNAQLRGIAVGGMPDYKMRMIYSTGPSALGFGGQPCNNTLIKGISFNANHNETNNNAYSKNCIHVFGSGTVIEDCEFYGMGRGSLEIPTGTPESFTIYAVLSSNNADGSQGAIVRRCLFRDNGNCTGTGVATIVSETTCVAVGGYVTQSGNYVWATGVVIEDCKVTGTFNVNTQRSPLHGLTLSTTKGGVITRNYFENYEGVCIYNDTWPQIGTKIYNNKAVNVWGFAQFSAYNWVRVAGASPLRIPHFQDISITRNTATVTNGDTFYNYANPGVPAFVVAYLYDYDLFPTYPGHTNLQISGNDFTPSTGRPESVTNLGGYWGAPYYSFVQPPFPYTYVNPTIYNMAAGSTGGEWASAKIFSLPVDWKEFQQAFTNSAVREKIGFGREQFQKLYDQRNASESELRAISYSQTEIGQMLRFFQMHGSGDAFWVPVWRSCATLSANIAAASVTFSVESAAGLSVGDWLAFVQPSGIVARARIMAIVGTTITVSSAPGALSKDGTIIAPLVLARVQRPRLTIDWINTEVAEARFLVTEVPPEYFEAEGEVTSQNLGLLLPRGFIYELSQTIGGITTTTRLTSYEKNLTVLGQSYTSRKMDHGSIKQSLFLDRDEIDIRSEVISGDPFVKIATNQSEAPLRITIKSVDVSGAVGTDPQVLFTGDILSVSVKGSKLSAKAVSAGTVFDRMYPRFRMQVGCNHALFSTGCALATANWKFTASITNPGTEGYPFNFVLGSVARVVGSLPTITAGWFAGGWIEVGSGASLVRRAIVDNTALAGSAMTVTLSRDPTPFPAVNTAVALYPGCDGAFATCSSKFSNALNFGGHPFLPPSNPSMFRVSKNIGGGKK